MPAVERVSRSLERIEHDFLSWSSKQTGKSEQTLLKAEGCLELNDLNSERAFIFIIYL